MQASMSFSSLQASYTTTHWSALGEEIKNNQANSVPQISEEEGNSQKTSNILSSTEILNNKIGDFQKQIINQALNKISEIQDEMIKVWEEVFGMSSENSSSTNTSISGSIESLLNGNFSRPSYNVGSGISITQGFYQSLELSIQGTIVGKDGVSRKLDLSINVSQSFVQNLQINSQNTNTNNTNSNKVIDPLVIDYAGNGTELSDTKMSFDLDSDGKEDQISTLKEGSGFLALDKNNDGKINNGNELFGTQSGDGFKDLSAYDLNQDGKIDKEDPIYDKLRIWTPNEKGEGELVGLLRHQGGAVAPDADGGVAGRLPIAQHAVMPGREPREQPRPCRRTAGTRSIGMREHRPLGRQAVQCRSDHPSPARTPHGIPALLVGHDQNHMRLHPGSSRHSGSPSGHTQRQNRQHLISLHATHPPFRHGSSSAASATQRAFPAAGVQDSPARMPPSCDKVADGCYCPSQSSAPR